MPPERLPSQRPALTSLLQMPAALSIAISQFNPPILQIRARPGPIQLLQTAPSTASQMQLRAVLERFNKKSMINLDIVSKSLRLPSSSLPCQQLQSPDE